jgi:hypothetical protein
MAVADSECQTDALLGIVVGRVDELVREPVLAAEIALDRGGRL